MPSKVKAYELQSKCVVGFLSVAGTFFLANISCAGVVQSFCRNKTDLAKQLVELKDDLMKLRVHKIAGGSTAKLTKMFVSLSTLSREMLIIALSTLQQCSPQIDRSGVDRDQPKISAKPSGVLQEKEVPPTRSATKEDEGYSKAADCGVFPATSISGIVP